MFSSVLKCSIDVLLICSIDVLKMLSDVPGCYQMFQVVLRLLSILKMFSRYSHDSIKILEGVLCVWSGGTGGSYESFGVCLGWRACWVQWVWWP